MRVTREGGLQSLIAEGRLLACFTGSNGNSRKAPTPKVKISYREHDIAKRASF